jgi:membrane protease subunit HflK
MPENLDPSKLTPSPETPEEAGAQALAQALRSSFTIIKVIMIGLVALFLFSGFFTVEPQDKAMILRFGRPVGGPEGELLNPGPHWAFPRPIDEIVRIPINQVQSVNSSIGWYATTPAAEAAGTEPPPGESLDPVRDGYLITGDENIIHARATLRYRIAEPGLRFMMDFAQATNFVQNALNCALLHAAARYRVDDALTRDQAGFRETVRERIQQLINQQGLGITIDQIEDVRLIPPRQCNEAFARVTQATVQQSRELNEARSYENQTVTRARAEAEARRNTGEADRARLVQFVAAEVERFTNNLPAFRANRELFIQQRQSEVLRVVFTNASEKTVLPQRGNASRTLWLQLNREPPKPRTLEEPKAEH